MNHVKVLSVFALVFTAGCGPEPVDCFDSIISSQTRAEQRNVQLVEEMILLLSTKTNAELAVTTTAGVDALDDAMRGVFISNREVSSDAFGEAQPITGGAGFGTVDVLGEPENLLGIYQGNTPSGVCNYPFAPDVPKTLDPDDPADQLVPYVASDLMQSYCGIVASCTTMQSSIYLNVSNPSIYGNKFKSFFDDGLINPSVQVWQTGTDWLPGGTDPEKNWAKLGWQNFNDGDLSGHHVIYLQTEVDEYFLLYYKPFTDVNGVFAGTAYSFVNLSDEYLANAEYQDLVDDGSCPMPEIICD